MRRLLLHHTYAGGRAVDASGNANHGHPTAVVAAGPSALRFGSAPSRVTVHPTAGTFDRVNGLHAQVRFRLDTEASHEHASVRPWTSSNRHNLIEGHLSFALVVHEGPYIVGRGRVLEFIATILDAEGNWTGPKGTILHRSGTWHTASMTYLPDSATFALQVDGRVIAERAGVQGPVRPVGPNGVAIGAWPEPDNRYTLKGDLDDVRVWATWPQTEDLVDDCCADQDSLRDLVADSAPGTISGRDPSEAIRELIGIGTAVRARVVGDSEDRAARAREAERAFHRALQDHDRFGMMRALGAGGRLVLDAGVPESWLVGQGERALEILMDTPVGRRALGPIVAAARRTRRSAGRRPSVDAAALQAIARAAQPALTDYGGALCLPAPSEPKTVPSDDEGRHWDERDIPEWPEDRDEQRREKDEQRREKDEQRSRDDQADAEPTSVPPDGSDPTRYRPSRHLFAKRDEIDRMHRRGKADS